MYVRTHGWLRERTEKYGTFSAKVGKVLSSYGWALTLCMMTKDFLSAHQSLSYLGWQLAPFGVRRVVYSLCGKKG